MKLFVNGCSHTEGTKLSLDGDLTRAWPHKLAKMLDAELVSFACAGSSNDRIIRTTVEEVSIDPLPADLAIIQFTGVERFEGIQEDGSGFLQFLPRPHLSKDVTDHVQLDKDTTSFVKRFFNPFNEKQKELLSVKLLTQILSLQNLFENHNIPYIFINWYKIPSELKNTKLYQVIDWSRFITNEDDMNSILNSHEFKLSKKRRSDGTLDLHFQSDAHKFIAEALIEFSIHKRPLVRKGEYEDDNAREVAHVYA